MNTELLIQAQAQIAALTATLNALKQQPDYDTDFPLDLDYAINDLATLNGDLKDYQEGDSDEEEVDEAA